MVVLKGVGKIRWEWSFWRDPLKLKLKLVKKLKGLKKLTGVNIPMQNEYSVEWIAPRKTVKSEETHWGGISNPLETLFNEGRQSNRKSSDRWSDTRNTKVHRRREIGGRGTAIDHRRVQSQGLGEQSETLGETEGLRLPFAAEMQWSEYDVIILEGLYWNGETAWVCHWSAKEGDHPFTGIRGDGDETDDGESKNATKVSDRQTEKGDHSEGYGNQGTSEEVASSRHVARLLAWCQ